MGLCQESCLYIQPQLAVLQVGGVPKYGGGHGGPSLEPSSFSWTPRHLRSETGQAAGSQQSKLVETKDRLTALPSLPLTELTAMAQVSPSEKMPAAAIRKLAQERTASSVTTLEAEVKLCTSTVEGLAFLLWRHLEHFLL